MSTAVIFESDYTLVAGRRIPMRDVGAHGEMQIGGAFGPILRPLSYGERTRIVLRAAGSRRAIDNVSSAVLRAALVQAGECERLIAEILALALAGAELDAPTFAETALTVARAAGWGIRQINEAEADEIDRLAITLGGTATPREDDGWHRIVFADDAAATSLEGVRRDLAERLIARAEFSPASRPTVEADEADCALPTTRFEVPIRSGLPSDDGTISPRVPSLYGSGSGATVDEQGDGGTDVSPASQPQIPRFGFGLEVGRKRDPLASPLPYREEHGVRAKGVRADENSMQESSLPHTRTSTAQVPDTRGQSFRVRANPKPQAISGVSLSSAADDLHGHPLSVTGTLERRPVNRVSYHSGGVAAPAIGAQGESHPIDRARPLPGSHAASMAPRPAPEAITLDPPALGQWGDPHVGFVPGVLSTNRGAGEAQVAESLPTLAQIERLVGEEVAEALAALLHHEADLRGIDP